MAIFRQRRDRAYEFECVALAHLGELLRVARRLCQDPERADDLVQETYLRAWRFWDSFEPGTNCRAWLYKIMFNCFRTDCARGTPPTVPIETAEVGRVLPFTPPPSVTARAVGDAFDKLPEDYRAVLLLVAVEGFSYKEAAETLDVPIGTVMSRVHRGREALRSLVDGRGAPTKRSSSSTGSG